MDYRKWTGASAGPAFGNVPRRALLRVVHGARVIEDQAADGGVAPVTSGRTGWPTGASGTPTGASSSAKSGGAHTGTSAPSARNCTASPTIGSTSPRDPYVDINTHAFRYSHFLALRACPAAVFGHMSR